MFVEKLTDEQIAKIISPKYFHTISNITRQKWNGRLYVSYACYSFNCLTVFEDFRVVYSDFAIDELKYRKFMLSQFKNNGYFEQCANFIKELKKVETVEDINSLKD